MCTKMKILTFYKEKYLCKLLNEIHFMHDKIHSVYISLKHCPF